MATSILLLLLLQSCFFKINTMMFGRRSFARIKIKSSRILFSYLSTSSSTSSLFSNQKYTELVLYDPSNQNSDDEIKQLKLHRPHLICFPFSLQATSSSSSTASKAPSRIWTAFGSSASSLFSSQQQSPPIQVDCIELQDYFISGKNQLTVTETVDKWSNLIDGRLQAIKTQSADSQQPDSIHIVNADDEKYLSIELHHALQAVQTASYMSRSLQNSLIGIRPSSTTNQLDGVGISKDDKSPVTIADFAVQALIIDRLSRMFPEDKFIAEEDSAMLKLENNYFVCAQIVDALSAVTQQDWTKQKLFDIIDKGNYRSEDEDGEGVDKSSSTNTHSTTTPARVWVLDPVDGTKGFLRGQHYCIALALLINGAPQLSVLGCPNLDLQHVLQGNKDVTKISSVTPPISVTVKLDNNNNSNNNTAKQPLSIFPPSTGSLFYAVSNQGAYAKSLSMPLSAGYEIQVDDGGVNSNSASAIQQILLCESTEASHGNRDVTIGVYNTLQLKTEYLRLDGQCKYGVVGAGAAQGNLRLPPAGYQEKIWDHAPGAHFVTEAGGSVTDLQGQPINFSLGRQLSKDITGIVASSGGQVHRELLRVVNQVKSEVEAREDYNKNRKFGLS